MLFVKRVSVVGLKGNFNAVLGPKTIILGPNFSGKTRIVNAVEYGTTGRVSDLRGRALVAEAASLRLLGNDPDAALLEADPEAQRSFPTVELTIGDTTNDAFALKVEAKGAKPSAPFPDAFPLRAVRAAVEGNAATLRKFLVQYAIGPLVREDILARLHKDLRAAYTDAAAAVGGKGPLLNIEDFDADPTETAPEGTNGELDVLLAVIDYAGKRSRKCDTEAKTLEKTIASAPNVTAPSDADLVELEKRVQAALKTYTTAAGNARAAVERAGLQKQLDAILTRHPALADADLSNTSKAPLTPTFKANMAVLRQHATDGALKCLVCGTACTEGHFTNRLSLVESKTAEREVKALRDELAASAELGADTLKTSADAKRIFEEARAAQATAIGNRAAWKQVDSARDSVTERQQAKVKFAALATACETVVKAMLQLGRDRFIASVQAYLPVGLTFGMELTPTRIDFGLVHEGRLDSALSGAEEVTVHVAMALATRATAATNSPCVIASPDRGLDAGQLSALMNAWNSAVDKGAQVILQGVTEPLFIPDGWTVIRTGTLLAPAAATLEKRDARARDGEWTYKKAKRTGTLCSDCKSPQVESPSGVTCSNGHGGADPAPMPVVEEPFVI